MRSNPQAFKQITVALNSLNNLTGRTGWFPGAKYEDGTPVAYAAALNELGHGNTPARPFMRPAVADNESKWKETIATAARRVVEGKLSGKSALELLVIQAEGDIKNAILDVFDPPLSPITLELRAMKKRDPSLKVTAATVGQAAYRVQQPGYKTPNVNSKPLVDSGLMIATLSSGVDPETPKPHGGNG